MTPNDTATAYGLFNVIFAELDQYLTWALLELRKHSDANATFEEIHEDGFERKRRALKQELKQFESKSAVDFELRSVREGLTRAKKVNEWRVARVHCLVHRTNDGLALYDWKSRKRLSMTAEECWEQIRELTFIIGEIKSNGLNLSKHLDWERQFDELWSENIS